MTKRPTLPPNHGNRTILTDFSCALMDTTAAEQAYMLSLWQRPTPLISHDTGMVVPVEFMVAIMRELKDADYADLLTALEYAKKQGAVYVVTRVVEVLS